ncbi:MAG: DUF1552 domain-containing protein [Myxococcota bacterium]
MAASLALPTLEVMLDHHGEAYANGAPLPVRMGIFFWGMGVRLDRWVPEQTGTEWSLSPEMAPLADNKPYLNVVSGYRAHAGYGRRGHHDGAAALLSATPFIALPHPNSPYSSKFGGPSIDQVAADIIGQNSLIPALHVGISKRVLTNQGPTLQYMSHRGPDLGIPSERNPRRVFERLFQNFDPLNSNTELEPGERSRLDILDAVKADADALRRRLGANDKRRLDAHLDGIRQLQREISGLPTNAALSCEKPATPAQSNEDIDGQEPMVEVNRVMAKLVAMAFACDLTRICTYFLTGGSGYPVYADLGHVRGLHELSHESRSQEKIHAAVVYNMGLLNTLLNTLRQTEIGAGNLLDRSVWLCTSDVAEGYTHSSRDYPIIVAGRAGEYFKYPGIHHRGVDDNNTSDVLLSVMRAAGTGLTQIGAAQGYSNQTCRAIETNA